MKSILVAATGLALLTTTAFAQNLPAPVKARQGQMRIIAINLGILGGMAKGDTAYDAATAQAAADSLAGVTMVSPGPLWPEGSDMDAVVGTVAKADIWTNMGDFNAKFEGLATAAKAMQAAAGGGQQAIGQAMGAVGGTCKDCHQTYRGKAN